MKKKARSDAHEISCTKLKSNVSVSISPSISAGFGYNANRICFFDPLFGRDEKTIDTGFTHNSLEFEGIKIGIV